MLLSTIKAKFATAHCNWCESKAILTGDAVEGCWLACTWTGIFCFIVFFSLNAQAIADTSTAKTGGLSVIFANTWQHRRPVSSRQVKGQINRVTVGLPVGLLDRPQGGSLLKQDAAACSSWLGKWHNKLDRWGNCAFLCTAATRNMHSSCCYHTLSVMYVFRFSDIAVKDEVNLLHSCFSLLYRSLYLTLWNTFVPFGCDIHLYTTRCFLL